MADYTDQQYLDDLALLVQNGKDPDGRYTLELRKASGFNAEQNQLGRQIQHLEAGLSPNFMTRAKEAATSTAVDAANGLTLGWGDEMLGAVSPNAAEDYRAQQKVSRQVTPWTSAATEIVGGLPLAMIPGGSTLLGAAGTGGVMGGIYGAGDAQEGDRLGSGIVGAGTGMVAGPLLSLVGKGAGKVAGKAPEVAAGAKRVYNELANMLSNQQGSINNRVPTPVNGMLTPGEKYAVGQMTQKNVAADELQQGLSQWAKTRQDIPEITLADSLGQNKAGSGDSILDTVNFLRSQPETKKEVSSMLVPRAEARADRAVSAIDNLFENGAPQDTTQHLFALRDAAKGKLDTLRAERQKEAEMFYDMAHKATPGRLETPQLNRLMKKDIMQEAQQHVRANFQDELRFKNKQGLHELDRMKQYFDDQYDKFSNKANSSYSKQLAEKYRQASKDLRATVDEVNPYYKQARHAFADSSEDINKIDGHKWGKEKQVGLFAKILNAQDANNPDLIGRAIDNLEPAQIKQLKKMLGKEHQGTFEDAYLQYIKNQMRGSKDAGQSPIAKFWTKREDNSTNRDVIKAAIGKEKYKQLSKQFDAELAMHETYVRSHTGSQTQPRQAEAARNVGIMAEALSGHPIRAGGRAIGKLVSASTGPADETMREYARMLLTDQAWTSMPKVVKAMQSKEYSKELAKVLMPQGQKAGATTGRFIAGRLPNQTEGN